ncbi:dTMP kinase [Thermodesulfobacteriota bacterium]
MGKASGLRLLLGNAYQLSGVDQRRVTYEIRKGAWAEDRCFRTGNEGRFIVFEGIDGSGKSTQAELLRSALEGSGLSVILTAEPSTGPVGRLIRTMRTRSSPREEARLFARDRREHLERVIKPALAAGRTVICDRYIHSSIAYQGARGIDLDDIMCLNSDFLVRPDLVVLLEVGVDEALSRIMAGRGSGLSLFEKRESLVAVREIYHSLGDPLFRLVDGTGTAQEVHAEVTQILASLCYWEGLFEESGRRT